MFQFYMQHQNYHLVSVLESFLCGTKHTDFAHLCSCGKAANTQPIRSGTQDSFHTRVCHQQISQTHINTPGNALTISSGQLLWTWSLLNLTRMKLLRIILVFAFLHCQKSPWINPPNPFNRKNWKTYCLEKLAHQEKLPSCQLNSNCCPALVSANINSVPRHTHNRSSFGEMESSEKWYIKQQCWHVILWLCIS